MPKDGFEHEDPMELVGLTAPPLTDDDICMMADGLVDEYVRMGWEDDEILALFTDPQYRMPHMIYQRQGETFVRSVVSTVRERWGAVWRFRSESTDEEPSRAQERGDFIPATSLGRFSGR
jgi:hypothetical protein